MSDLQLIAKKSGIYSIFWDDERGSVAVDLDGFWSIGDMNDFVASLEIAIDKSRSRHGNALLLFDALKNQVLPNAVFDTVKADSKKLSSDNDRVAIVVASSLLKLQMKRMSSANTNCNFFVSRNAADTWLHAHIHTAVSSTMCDVAVSAG